MNSTLKHGTDRIQYRSITGYTIFNKAYIGRNGPTYHHGGGVSTFRSSMETDARMAVGEEAYELGGRLVKEEGQKYASEVIENGMSFTEDGDIRVDWIARFYVEFPEADPTCAKCGVERSFVAHSDSNLYNYHEFEAVY